MPVASSRDPNSPTHRVPAKPGREQARLRRGRLDQPKILAKNRKARFDYEIDSTIEAGIVLVGSEFKALREAQASLVDAYARERAGELWLIGAKIHAYSFANVLNHEPERERKLLLHRREITRLARAMQEKGFVLVPLSLYLKQGKVKVELALAKGKRAFEKRARQRAKDAQREIDVATSRRR